MWLCAALVFSQEITTEKEEETSQPELNAAEASIFTQKNARTMTLSIPAPRGLILDRNGYPLAQTKVAYSLALDFAKVGMDAGAEEAVAWARSKLAKANALVGGEYSISEKRIVDYYKHRRWIPRAISKVFDEEKAKSLEGTLPDGLTLVPVYLRHYPEKSIAAHLIGYVGTKTRLPDGPINDGDPLFSSVEGRGGFENIFNDEHWKSQDFIIIAVDNGKARRYIDERANWHELTIIESGTLGIISSNMTIIPK